MNNELAPALSHQALSAKTKSKPGRVTGKLRDACDAIVHEGMSWDKAAVKAGLTVRTMRLALERPHVLRHLREQKEVLRLSLVAQNPRRLAQLRDQDENKSAAVNAARALENTGDDQNAPGARPMTPGLTIIIHNRATAPGTSMPTPGIVIDHEPADGVSSPRD